MFAGQSSLVTIAKVDATLNDVPDEIQGFPTIKLFTAKDKKNPIEYSGARTAEDLANFVRDNGSNKADPNVKGDTSDDTVETEGMPHQAAAATEAAEGMGEKIAHKVADGVKAAATAMMDSDDNLDDHDEL